MVVKSTRPKHGLTDDQLQATAELFAVLSEPTRLRILQVLQKGPATVSQIMQASDIKQANASKQLGILHQAGVLERARQGTQVLYSIRMPLVFDLCHLVCNSLRDDLMARARRLS
jgi:DNA-binding transcriptional ArsR family regulator